MISFRCLYVSIVFMVSLELPCMRAEDSQGINIILRNPIYSDGLLSTNEGGLITTDRIRVQALRLSYQKTTNIIPSQWNLEAEGDLLIEFKDFVFTGDRLFYDFQTKTGYIKYAQTLAEPWFFGGSLLKLNENGSIAIDDGYATTSEKNPPQWGIFSNSVEIDPDKNLYARDISVKYFDHTVFWIPSFRTNLDEVLESPLKYRLRLGGRQGPRFGLTYEIFSKNRWTTFLRFDYRLTRGPGAGFETNYRSEDRKTEFQSVSYVAMDSSILNFHEKARYRFEGLFKKRSQNEKRSLLITYDKISDEDMPNCYNDEDFFIQTSYRTQLLARVEENNWISNFYSRVRINRFQTVKEQLPTLDLTLKPFVLGPTGIIFENKMNASYLNFRYSKSLHDVKNYNSTRLQYFPTLYRAISLKKWMTFLPEVGGIGIIYGNSPEKEAQYQVLGKFALTSKTELYRYYDSHKHLIEPYVIYQYYTSPTIQPHRHYIFDMSDGWYRLNYLTLGCRSVVYKKAENLSLSIPFQGDLYAYAFFNTKKMRQTIPRIYADFTFYWLPTVKNKLESAWDLERNQLDHFNFLTEFTLSHDFAISAEYRHRSSYSWRKVDTTNFFLDVFHSERKLRHSHESDRRDTLLLHFFYRFHPNWACEFTSRQGWNRCQQPNYSEFEIDFYTTVQTAWQVRFSFQHEENENTVAMFVNIGFKRPESGSGPQKMLVFD